MFLGEMALSPDGARLAYGLAKPGGQPQLWIRSLEAAAGQPVPEGENAFFPFWSPDGRFVLFDRFRPQGGDVWLMEGLEPA